MDTVKFYFSFRSPYAWLAFHRLLHTGGEWPVEFRRIPVFPPPNFPNDPAAVPAKLAYILADAQRVAAAYGLAVRWPQQGDTDWMRPHAAYVYAAQQGCGDAFAMQVYAARFQRGADVGADETLRAVATACGLDAAATLRACDDAAVHARVMEGMIEGLRDGLFGVPFFVHAGETYWGNDRLEWLLRALYERSGRPVPDIRGNLLAAPHR
jgi:2-hydroxychromene-2-carboxylate isomerase